MIDGVTTRDLKFICDERGRLVVLLTAPDEELVLVQAHVELLKGEAGDRKRDPHAFGVLVVLWQSRDVVGRIAVSRLRHAVERSLDLIEADKERT